VLRRPHDWFEGRGRHGTLIVFIDDANGSADRAAVRPGGVGCCISGRAARSCSDALRRSVIERLGATFIDRSKSVADYVTRLTGGRGFDIIYDTAGGATLDASFEVVRRFGHVVRCLGWGRHKLASLSFKATTCSGIFTLLPRLTGEGRAYHGDILLQAT
jgi:NADPH2:quinone reductase